MRNSSRGSSRWGGSLRSGDIRRTSVEHAAGSAPFSSSDVISVIRPSVKHPPSQHLICATSAETMSSSFLFNRGPGARRARVPAGAARFGAGSDEAAPWAGDADSVLRFRFDEAAGGADRDAGEAAGGADREAGEAEAAGGAAWEAVAGCGTADTSLDGATGWQTGQP